MIEDDTATTDGTSRRSAIKKLAVGSAVVWSAPAILSTAKAAAAGSAAEPTCPGSCGDIAVCGSNPSSADGSCYTFAPDCECWSNVFCNQSPACDSTSECPAGWICITTCCGKSCIPLCATTFAAASGVSGGATAARPEPTDCPLAGGSSYAELHRRPSSRAAMPRSNVRTRWSD